MQIWKSKKMKPRGQEGRGGEGKGREGEAESEGKVPLSHVEGHLS